MPIGRGLAITNAFRDIMAGHLISGVARGTEALFIAGAIGGGIIVAFNFFYCVRCQGSCGLVDFLDLTNVFSSKYRHLQFFRCLNDRFD